MLYGETVLEETWPVGISRRDAVGAPLRRGHDVCQTPGPLMTAAELLESGSCGRRA